MLGAALPGVRGSASMGGLIFAFLFRSAAPRLGLEILDGVGVPGFVETLAALYPAHRAARLLPAEAARYE